MREQRTSSREADWRTGRIVSLKDDLEVLAAMLDVSEGGACLLVPDSARIPDEFQLFVDRSDMSHHCEVRWRSGRKVGVKFRDPCGVSAAGPGMPGVDATGSLISALQIAVGSSQADERMGMMRRVADLFLANAERITDEQIELFGDVLLHLIERLEHRALIELGTRLAPVDRSPAGVIRVLARHDDAAVAASVLSTSRRLTDDDLIDVARTRSQGHLFAIAGRRPLAAPVTDVVVEFGQRNVLRRVAANPGASFSEQGFKTLVDHAEGDVDLAERLGCRLDLPVPLLHELLRKASDTVRERILATAPIELRGEVNKAISAATQEVVREQGTPRDYAGALDAVARLKLSHRLDEAALVAFARERKTEMLVAGLATMSGAPVTMIERLMQNVRHDGVVITCRALEFKWSSVGAILSGRFAHHSPSDQQLAAAKSDYYRLSVPTAQRVFRFWLVRDPARAAEIEPAREAG